MLTIAAYAVVLLLLVIAVLLLRVSNGVALSAEYLASIQEILVGPQEKIRGPIGKGSVVAEIAEIKSLLKTQGND